MALRFALVVLAAGCLRASAHGDYPRVPEPSPLFTGSAIPDPPEQKKPWNLPATKVPAPGVAAAALLFEQGLADPRGCEYRAIRVTTGSCWTGDAGVVSTRGWVLPADAGVRHRFAVGWNGLVYPVVSVGERVELKADVRAALTTGDGRQVIDLEKAGNGVQSDEGWHLLPARFGEITVALLLRLGEIGLAEEVWAADNPPPKDGKPQDDYDPYYGNAHSSVWQQFERALYAHMRGDDALALHSFRRLDAFAAAARAELKKRGEQPPEDEKDFFTCLGQLPELLADQERRARERRPPVICLGPEQEPDAVKRIDALIARLDEVDARQDGQPGGVALGADPVVQALIRAGEPALGPLLDCFESDRRMTRSVHFWRDFVHARTCLAVHEAAYTAISAILHHADFEPATTGDNLTKRGEEGRRELAVRLRTAVKTAKRTPPVERWWKVLANDRAADEWTDAAGVLTSFDDRAGVPGTTVWTGRVVALRPGDAPKPKLIGEPLRDRKNPSVSELIARRSREVKSPRAAADLALALADWDAAAAVKPLADATTRNRDNRDYRWFLRLVETRVKLGDAKVLDEYAEWIRGMQPDGFPSDIAFQLRPMADHPDHPAVAAVSAKMFSDPKSPWLPYVRVDLEKGDRWLPELLERGLIGIPGLRDSVRAQLDDRTGAYKIEVNSEQDGKRDLDIPEVGIKGTYRVCDSVAHLVGEKVAGAPRCELYLPVARRDEAVTACKEFLKRYGNRAGRLDRAWPLKGPATAEQVRRGDAVFSLAGMGEVRTVKGLTLPIDAVWVTLKNRPFRFADDPAERAPRYVQDGVVVQAEEVFRDGRWQRYYGFVGCNRVERVPAAEIEFPAGGRWAWDDEDRAWVRSAPGLDARPTAPVPVGSVEDFPPRLAADARFEFAIRVRNADGSDQAAPDLGKLVRLQLWYSPEHVSPKGAFSPVARRRAEWVELKARPGVAFRSLGAKELGPMAEADAAAFDLREWFDVIRPGFYRLRIVPIDGSVATDGPAGELTFSVASPRPTKR